MWIARAALGEQSQHITHMHALAKVAHIPKCIEDMPMYEIQPQREHASSLIALNIMSCDAT